MWSELEEIMLTDWIERMTDEEFVQYLIETIGE